MSQKMKMHMIRVTGAVNNDGMTLTFMVYGQSKPSARKRFNDMHVSVARATDLEIAAHVRAGLPILGEPDPVDEKQGELDL